MRKQNSEQQKDQADDDSISDAESRDTPEESVSNKRDHIKVTMTKKDKKSAPAEKKIIRHIGEDPSRLIAELSPGKKGGDYELPFGGQISIPATVFGKKDVVTCCMAAPSDRHKYLPPLRSDEHLLSEVFLLATSVKNLKKEMHLRLPYKQENMDLFEIHMLAKRVESDEWAAKEFSLSKKGRYVEFISVGGGIFVVVSKPKMETFEIPVQGCLYNSRLSHQISVRFPKKATGIDLMGDIVISQFNRKNLPNLAKDFPIEMADLVSLSDYVTIRTNIPTTFKRAATVKLPLPPLEQEEFAEDDMVLMVRQGGQWSLQETGLKFTKSSVMFDTKEFHTYCVALSAPGRKRRLVNTFARLCSEDNVTRGQILPFLHIQEKLWTVFIHLVPNESVDECVRRREAEGFRLVRKIDIPQETVQDKQPFRRNWRTKVAVPTETKPDRKDLDLFSGHVFDFELSGEILLVKEENTELHMGLHYQDRLEDNYRKFFVEPRLVKDFTDLTGSLRIFSRADNEASPECVREFSVEANAEEVDAYFYEPPEPEPELEPVVKSREETPAPPPPTVNTRPPTASFLRLISHTKPPRTVIKESRVLTGKSLQCLAREIEQGLTLAIHLDISDSCITGLGFDALANGLSLADITYRILLLWKRRTSKLKDAQVTLLTAALQDMGRNDVAAIVAEQHRRNKELTTECFEMPRLGDDLISAVA